VKCATPEFTDFLRGRVWGARDLKVKCYAVTAKLCWQLKRQKLVAMGHFSLVRQTFAILTQRIFLARLFCAASPAAPGGNCQWRRNRRSRRFNEPGPPSSCGPRVGPQKLGKMCEMTHLHCTRRVFTSRRGHLRTQKHQNSWQLGAPTGEFTSLPRPRSTPSPKTHSRSQHFNTSDFQLQLLQPKPLRAPPSYC